MPRWLVILLASPALSCMRPGPTTDSASAQGLPAIRLEPTQLDLGEVAIGESTTGTFRIHNEGDEVLRIADIAIDSQGGGLDLDALGPVSLEPGQISELSVRFEPSDSGNQNAEITVTSDDPTHPEVRAWVFARGSGPALQVSVEASGLEEVPLGCEATRGVVLTNEGNADLTVHALGFEATCSGVGELSLDPLGADQGQGTSSLILNPGEHRVLVLRYLPQDEVDDSAVLRVESDDPGQPVASFVIEASGLAERWATETFVQVEQGSLDMVVALDTSGSMSSFLTSVGAELLSLASALAETESDVRLAVSTRHGGCIAGERLFIDSDTEPSSIAGALEAMFALEDVENIDAERAFTQLENTLGESDAGGCNEGLLRDRALLHLVAISNEPEQSEGDWEDHLATLRAAKDDPTDVILHGVGGDHPSGCGGAASFDGVWEASTASGGLFLSICSFDWWRDLRNATEDLEGSLDTLTLAELAVPGSLAVSIDGERTEEGWSFDEGVNLLRFDADHIPPGGSEISVTYAVQGPCDEAR
jgi:hypothetical protein